MAVKVRNKYTCRHGVFHSGSKWVVYEFRSVYFLFRMHGKAREPTETFVQNLQKHTNKTKFYWESPSIKANLRHEEHSTQQFLQQNIEGKILVTHVLYSAQIRGKSYDFPDNLTRVRNMGIFPNLHTETSTMVSWTKHQLRKHQNNIWCI
jgi:hypothetical protein